MLLPLNMGTNFFLYNMNKLLLVFSFLLISSGIFSQEIVRVEVSGKINVKDNDIEGVTVYNMSSEKGTITDFDGNFTIDVALNDRIEISALQFKKFIVVVDEGIIEQKRMSIFMVEQVNTLPEVVVTPYDLSGNIIVDVNRVKTLNLPFGEDQISLDKNPVNLTPDDKTRVYNQFVRGAGGKADMLGGDVIGLVGFLLKPLFKKKKKKTDIEKYNERTGIAEQNSDVLDLRLMYTNEYMKGVFGIPEDKVNEFIVYVEDNGLDYDLLKKGREMEFIDFLVQQSKTFLDLQSEKD